MNYTYFLSRKSIVLEGKVQEITPDCCLEEKAALLLDICENFQGNPTRREVRLYKAKAGTVLDLIGDVYIGPFYYVIYVIYVIIEYSGDRVAVMVERGREPIRTDL